VRGQQRRLLKSRNRKHDVELEETDVVNDRETCSLKIVSLMRTDLVEVWNSERSVSISQRATFIEDHQ
jgi:hypothetical protein